MHPLLLPFQVVWAAMRFLVTAIKVLVGPSMHSTLLYVVTTPQINAKFGSLETQDMGTWACTMPKAM